MPIPLKDWALTMWKTSFWANKTVCVLTLVLLVLLCSCEDSDARDTSSSITITDALGREVEIPKNPQRVAALIGSFADIWQLAGGEIVAAPEDAWTDFGLDLDDAVNIGGAHSPSLELLFSANPELVLASASTSANVEMLSSLNSASINVVYFDVDSFEDYLEMLDICTDITGRKDLYEQNGLMLKEKIDSVINAPEIKRLPEEQRRILLLRASSGSVKAKGSNGTVLGEMLCDLGMKNIADSNKGLLENLSIESIISADPYHIFVVTMGNDTKAAQDNIAKMIMSNPAWSTLTAIKENRLHFMDKRLYNIKPNIYWADAYEQLSKILQAQ